MTEDVRASEEAVRRGNLSGLVGAWIETWGRGRESALYTIRWLADALAADVPWPPWSPESHQGLARARRALADQVDRWRREHVLPWEAAGGAAAVSRECTSYELHRLAAQVELGYQCNHAWRLHQLEEGLLVLLTADPADPTRLARLRTFAQDLAETLQTTAREQSRQQTPAPQG